MTLAITGTTGNIGRHVLDQVSDLAPRLIVRNPAKAPEGFEVAVTEYGDSGTALAALRGVDVLFMVSGSESPVRRQQHRTFIAAAAEAGVRHIVYTSFFGASPDAAFTLARDHADAEAAIRESGMDYTLLRDNLYLDFFPMFADESGVIRGPAGEGRAAGVARADVADAAAAVLRDPEAHRGALYELTGPEAVSLGEAAARMEIALGRPFSYVQETLAEAYASRRKFTDEQWQLDAWVSTYTAIADGELERVTGDVPKLTGHPARTLEQAITGE